MTEKKEWHSHIKRHGMFRSKFEASIAEQLEVSGVEFSYEVEKIRYRTCTGEHFYIPDFAVYFPQSSPNWPASWGDPLYIEAKGWMNNEARLKMEAVRRCNPLLRLGFVFQDGKTKVARLKSTGPVWAGKHRFDSSVGMVPAEWLRGALMKDGLAMAA